MTIQAFTYEISCLENRNEITIGAKITMHTIYQKSMVILLIDLHVLTACYFNTTISTVQSCVTHSSCTTITAHSLCWIQRFTIRYQKNLLVLRNPSHRSYCTHKHLDTVKQFILIMSDSYVQCIYQKDYTACQHLIYCYLS